MNKPKRKEIDLQRDGQKTRKFDQLLINKPYTFIQKRRQTKELMNEQLLRWNFKTVVFRLCFFLREIVAAVTVH